MAVIEAIAVPELLKRIDRRAALLIYGSDESAVREFAASIVKAVAGSLDDPFAVTRLEDAQLAKDKGLLADEAGAMPLIDTRRVVWVSGAGQGFLTAVEPLLEGPTDRNLIVAEAGILAKSAALRTLFERSERAAIIPIYEDDPQRVRRIVADTLSAADLGAAEEAIERLLEVLGPARAQLRQELSKLVLYCAGKREVGLEDVEAVCGEASEPSADDACDAAFGGRLDETDMHLRRLLAAGLSGGRLVSALLGHAARLREMRAAIATGKPTALVMKTVRPPIFFRRQPAISQQLNLWDVPKLDDAATTLLDAVRQTRELPALEDAIAVRSVLSIARAAGRS